MSIIDQILSYITNESHTVTVVLGIFVIVIALAFWGARRIETD